MVADGTSAAVREILVVLALAVAGLLLALLAAFTPWYGGSAEPGRTQVVEIHEPTRTPDKAQRPPAEPVGQTPFPPAPRPRAGRWCSLGTWLPPPLGPQGCRPDRERGGRLAR
jgi:hypothetical protein